MRWSHGCKEKSSLNQIKEINIKRYCDKFTKLKSIRIDFIGKYGRVERV